MKLPFVLLAPVLLVCSCSWFRSKSPKVGPVQPVVEAPKLVGRIASIPKDKRFVLIQSYGGWNVAAGSVLTTRGADERAANLRVTGESLGQFAAADVQAGLVEVGDAVYSRPAPGAAVAEVSPAGNAPAPAPSAPPADVVVGE